MGVKDILRPLVHSYENSFFKWYFIDNFKAQAMYRLNSNSMPPAVKHVAEILKRDGICITSVKELFGSEDILNEITAEVARIEAEKASQIAEQRNRAGEVADEKYFVFKVLGGDLELDTEGPFGKFALNPVIRDVANSYYGMFSQLRFFDVWRNFTTNAPPMRSQLWHRDREDRGIIKVFLYLNDVDEGAGPFTYAPDTHLHGSIKKEPPYFYESEKRRNPRSTDEQMVTVVPENKWIKAVGKKGTVIFADTAGYHKGGLARERDRLLFNLLYVSPASNAKTTFSSVKKGYTPADMKTRHALSSIPQ